MISGTDIPRLSATRRRIFASLLVLSVAVLLAVSAAAKENPATAIVLFDGPAGPAYVQVTGVTLNGKSELRDCEGVPRINKTVYDNLARPQLGSGSALERGADGVLMLTVT